MKLKKWIARIMIALCIISTIALVVVIFTGCTASAKSVSENLTNYDLNLTFNDENMTVTGVQKVDYKNNTDICLNQLKFHLYPNAFREGAKISPVSLTNEHKAYPNGKSYGRIDIKSAKVSGMNCSLKLNDLDNINNPSYQITGKDENILQINLTKELFPDDRIEIEMEYLITLPNVNHRFGYGDNTINLGNFYPIACVYENGDFKTDLYHYNGDPFYSEMANYNLSITFPNKYKMASSGNLSSSNSSVNLTTNTITATAVRDFAIVLSDQFEVISKDCNGVSVSYYYFSDTDPEKSLETACKSITTFNNLIGKYPYKTLSVVEANFVHGGMEYPNLIYIASDITDHTQYEQVIVHETAHQWWYNVVGNSEYDNGWLDEGLTEYTTALYYEINPNEGVDKNAIIKNAYSNYQMFVEVYSGVYGDLDTSMDRNLSEFKTEPEYVYLTYVKGMLMFDTLREILGFEKFKKCLQQYYSDNAFKIAKPENMISSFEKASKTKLESIFNAWIDGKVILLN